jgi:hypothetical protein
MRHFSVKRIGDCFYEMTAHEKPGAPAAERYRALVADDQSRAGNPGHLPDLASLSGCGPTPDEAFEALAATISKRRRDERA